MQVSSVVLSLLGYALPLTLTLTLTLSVVRAETSDAEATCGSVRYSSDKISEASSAACRLVESRGRAGGSNYPHVYKNYEGIRFKVSQGPFYEFPIKSGGVYNGGSPGADRVIITKNCQEAGVITHRGASGNSFVACQVTGKNGTKNGDKPGNNGDNKNNGNNGNNGNSGSNNSNNSKKGSSANTLQHSLRETVSAIGTVAGLLLLL